MAIGKRIKYFRTRKGLTQKQLGEMLGFHGKTSDVRVAQYESEARVPKNDLVKEMANIFGVSTRSITVPAIDDYVGLMQTLFALEDMYGLQIFDNDGEPCLRINPYDNENFTMMFNMFSAWQEQAALLKEGKITRDEYDNWRYNYPSLDTSGHWAKVPPQGIFSNLNDIDEDPSTDEN